ncbi:MAG: M24 family metallopeptidase, partial [Deltaproteobacteria bacterium]|nr:M24 family metallopeptidase [Deltaproteobacteria bacterium]
ESVAKFFESAADPKPVKEALAALIAQTNPKTIALGIDGKRGVTRSLTRSTYQFLAEAVGPEIEKRFVPAEPLIEEYLDTRLPEETAPYLSMVRLTESLTHRALSNEVITPGKTTVGDLRRFLYDELGKAGVSTWFQPDVRVQRKGNKSDLSRGFLSVAQEAEVIQRGDLVHIDFGVTYLGLNTDWQKMAYVLGDGETDAPAGLKVALAHTNALQEAVMQESKPGRAAADVYEAVMARMATQGIEAQVYSHPLGNQGHGLGASIDMRSATRKEPSKELRKGSWLALELNSKTPVPEWGGQLVYVMEEDPVRLTDEGWVPFVPRQTSFYLVK